MLHLSTSVWRSLEISTAGLHVQNASWSAINLVRLIAFSVVDCYGVYFESKDICCATSEDKSAYVPTPAQRNRAKSHLAGTEAGVAATLSRSQRRPITCRDPSLSAVFQMRLIYTHTSHFLSGSPQPCPPMQQRNCSHSHESGNLGIQENKLFYEQLFTSLKHTVHLLLGSGNFSGLFIHLYVVNTDWPIKKRKNGGCYTCLMDYITPKIDNSVYIYSI